MQVGYDIFYLKPGSTTTQHCKVCGAECDVTRDVYGPSSTAAAIGRKYTLQDVFVCPHADADWHEQALRLVLAIQETPSKRLAALMQQDLNDLLEEHKPA